MKTLLVVALSKEWILCRRLIVNCDHQPKNSVQIAQFFSSRLPLRIPGAQRVYQRAFKYFSSAAFHFEQERGKEENPKTVKKLRRSGIKKCKKPQ